MIELSFKCSKCKVVVKEPNRNYRYGFSKGRPFCVQLCKKCSENTEDSVYSELIEESAKEMTRAGY